MHILQIDDELAKKIEAYRVAKATASAARKLATKVERAGHYDKDTPLQTRNAQEGEATVEERNAALQLADELLARADQSR
jgi:hypothetical protein